MKLIETTIKLFAEQARVALAKGSSFSAGIYAYIAPRVVFHTKGGDACLSQINSIQSDTLKPYNLNDLSAVIRILTNCDDNGILDTPICVDYDKKSAQTGLTKLGFSREAGEINCLGSALSANIRDNGSYKKGLGFVEKGCAETRGEMVKTAYDLKINSFLRAIRALLVFLPRGVKCESADLSRENNAGVGTITRKSRIAEGLGASPSNLYVQPLGNAEISALITYARREKMRNLLTTQQRYLCLNKGSPHGLGRRKTRGLISAFGERLNVALAYMNNTLRGTLAFENTNVMEKIIKVQVANNNAAETLTIKALLGTAEAIKRIGRCLTSLHSGHDVLNYENYVTTTSMAA